MQNIEQRLPAGSRETFYVLFLKERDAGTEPAFFPAICPQKSHLEKIARYKLWDIRIEETDVN